MFNTSDGKRRNLKLYVRRVFITDDCNELVPEWLSFIKGIVDSDDLPLNVSREMLQQSRLMKVIQKNVVKKAVEMFTDLAEDKPDDYVTFYDAFAKNIKLGVYDGHDSYKDKLVSLLRFHSSNSTSGTNDPATRTSLLDYTTRAKEGQKRIYYITGESVDAVKTSPFLDKLKAKGYEVLFLTEAIDEYMMQRLKEYKPPSSNADAESAKTFTFTCITKEGELFDEDASDEDTKAAKEARIKSFEPLCVKMKELLKDKVEKVVVSDRLAGTPGALVTGSYGWSANMERIMKAQALQNSETFFHMKSKKTLEINPDHKLIKAFKKMEAEGKGEGAAKAFKNICDGFYDATLLQSGFALDDPAKFVGRFFKLMEAGLSLDEEDADAEADADDVPEERTMETLD
jgi:molecular chaperone HtpG